MTEALTTADLFAIGLFVLSGFALGVLFTIFDCNRRGH